MSVLWTIGLIGAIGIISYTVYKGMGMPNKSGLPFIKMVTQVFLFAALIAADLVMFYFLITGLIGGTLSPEVAAIIGTIVGAVTTSLVMASKDFFNPNDNGVMPPPPPGA